MRLTEKQDKEFHSLTGQLIKWLNENSHPHTHIVVTTNTAELSEGVCAYTNDEFVKG
mgnify:CR=1 FL=1